MNVPILSFMLDWYSFSALLFIIAIILALYKDRKNVERQSIMFLRRTDFGREQIKYITDLSPRFWKWVGNAGIIIGFAVSVYIFYYMIEALYKSLIAPVAAPTLSVVLPSISSQTTIGTGYIAVPFWYWIISIALLVIVHEGFHGIMTIAGKSKIKALGWGVLAILPLAFVEPDEKNLAKKNLVTRLRVYAAGSLANFIFAALYMALFAGLAASLFVPGGATYQGTIEGFPAADASMQGAIISIDGYDVNNAQDLTNALEISGANNTITVITDNGTDKLTYDIETKPYPNQIEFNPDWTTDFIIGIESNFPGTVSLLNSVSSSFGGEEIKSWATLTYEKKFWEYAIESNPAIAKTAESNLADIEQQLEGRNEPGFIGIAGVSTYNVLKTELLPFEPVIGFAQGLLFFLFLLNFGVGLANLLPILPLDGGKMWDDLFKEYFPKHADLLIRIISWATFLIIIAGFIVPFLK